jgi:hypothetical protein
MRAIRSGDGTVPREREWKWLVPSPVVLDALERVEPPAGVVAGEWRSLSLQNTYYDTPDGLLRAQRVAFRVRRDGADGVLVTLKESHRREGAFHQVTEWEVRLASFAPRTPWLGSGAPVRRLLELVGRRPLREWVHFTTRRRERPFLSRGTRVATQVLDRTLWSSGGEFLEMEFELGPRESVGDRWQRWMESVAGEHELLPSESTKLARALAQREAR